MGAVGIYQWLDNVLRTEYEEVRLLKQSGRDEIATIAAIAGLIIGLLMMLDMIEALFDSVRQVFNLY